MTTKKPKNIKPLKGKAEVTDKGITSLSGEDKQKLVVNSSTTYGSFKQVFIAGTILLLAGAVGVGLVQEWESWYVNVAWPLGFLTSLAVATVLTTPME